jgi:DNA-binding transcriptional ArsR family regulator
MTIKLRPVDCCTTPAEAEPLREAERSRLVAVFRALGDPTRLEIFRLIARRPQPICVCDVTERFQVSQPTISHHLKVLRDAGLVEPLWPREWTGNFRSLRAQFTHVLRVDRPPMLRGQGRQKRVGERKPVGVSPPLDRLDHDRLCRLPPRPTPAP